MTEFRDYKRYTSDPKWAAQYSDYQKRYAVEPRESDKEIARLIGRCLRSTVFPKAEPFSVLDIGCSTGNLLRFLRRIYPKLSYAGGDLMKPHIDECKADEELAGMRFEVMDIFDLPSDKPFDVIIANAVCQMFEQDEYERAVASMARALGPDGWLIAYELIFPGDKEQRVIEKSLGHPEGLKFWLRSERKTRQALERAGFDDIAITPFEIPIDLPKPISSGTDDDLRTYTVRDPVTHRNLMFRGELYQPWAHICARKLKSWE